MIDRLALISDTHATNEIADAAHEACSGHIATFGPQFTHHGGDMIGGPGGWARFAELAAYVQAGKFSCQRGNWENSDGGWDAYYSFASQYGIGAGPWRKTFELVELFALDVWEPNAAPPDCPDYSMQQDWLAAALANSTRPFKVVLMHTPMFWDGVKNANLCARYAFKQIIEDAGAQLSIGFHRHAYAEYQFIPTTLHLTSGCAACTAIPHEAAPGEIPGRLFAASYVDHWLSLQTMRFDDQTVKMVLAAHDVNDFIFRTTSFIANYPAAPQHQGKDPFEP